MDITTRRAGGIVGDDEMSQLGQWRSPLDWWRTRYFLLVYLHPEQHERCWIRCYALSDASASGLRRCRQKWTGSLGEILGSLVVAGRRGWSSWRMWKMCWCLGVRGQLGMSASEE